MSWISTLLLGLRHCLTAGEPLSDRPTLNFTGSGVTAIDNPAKNRTDITIQGPIRVLVVNSSDVPTVAAGSGVSVTNVSTGVTRCTFDVAFPSALYFAQVTPEDVGGGQPSSIGGALIRGRTSTYLEVLTWDALGAPTSAAGWAFNLWIYPP